MTTVNAEKARTNLSELLSRAHFGKERILVTKNGKRFAALVPLEDFELLEKLKLSKHSA